MSMMIGPGRAPDRAPGGVVGGCRRGVILLIVWQPFSCGACRWTKVAQLASRTSGDRTSDERPVQSSGCLGRVAGPATTSCAGKRRGCLRRAAKPVPPPVQADDAVLPCWQAERSGRHQPRVLPGDLRERAGASARIPRPARRRNRAASPPRQRHVYSHRVSAATLRRTSRRRPIRRRRAAGGSGPLAPRTGAFRVQHRRDGHAHYLRRAQGTCARHACPRHPQHPPPSPAVPSAPRSPSDPTPPNPVVPCPISVG